MSGRVYLSVAIALSGLASWVGQSTPGWAVPSEPVAEAGKAADGEAIAQAPSSNRYTVLHVNPRAGNNLEGTGTQRQPLKTITYALRVAQPNTLILLSEGVYSADTGEDFPLQMRSGVTVQGAAGPNTADVVILGGAGHVTPSQGIRNITILGADSAGLANVTVSNPHASGIGLWIESESPIIQEAAFFQNGSTGIYIAAGGSPVIRDSYFSENGEAGLVIAGPSSAQIQGNVFENSGTGISVAPEATPVISDNRISHNHDGLVLHAEARPALENNQIQRNRRNSILDYSPWSHTSNASAVQATQPPPPSTPAAAIAPPPTSSPPLAIGGIASEDGQIATIPRPPASAPPTVEGEGTEANPTQSAATIRPPMTAAPEAAIPEAATSEIGTSNNQHPATIRPPVSLVPETIAPDPRFSEPPTDTLAVSPPGSQPQVQTGDELVSTDNSVTTTPESFADTAPEAVDGTPAVPESRPAVVANDAFGNNLHSADPSISPVEVRVVNNRRAATLQPLPTITTNEASTNDVYDAESQPTATDVVATSPAPENVAIAAIPVIPTTALFATVDLTPTLQVPEAIASSDALSTTEAIAPEVSDNDELIADNTDTSTTTGTLNPDASLRPSDVVPSLSESSTRELSNIAAVPVIPTTALFSTVNLTPTLQVPEAIATSIANQPSAATSDEDALIADEADGTDEAMGNPNSDASLRPSDVLASLNEPSLNESSLNESSLEIDRDRQQTLSETDEASEAIDLRIIPPSVESIATPTQASLGLRDNRLAFSEEPIHNLEEPLEDVESLPEFPPFTANSSSAEVARILVPSSDIPVGSGGALPEIFAADAPPSEGPPPPPSRASALGLPYKVLVVTSDPATQELLRQAVPDTFRVVMNGQEFMQAGAYPTLAEAQALVERLNQQGFQVQIEQIP